MSITRRTFLCGCGALGATALASARGDAAQSAGAAPFRIDTHSHFTVPELYEQATARGVSQPTLTDWTARTTLEQLVISPTHARDQGPDTETSRWLGAPPDGPRG